MSTAGNSEPKTVTIEPNWDGMRAWLRNVAATDLNNAIKINDTMGCEGIEPTELVEIHEKHNPPSVYDKCQAIRAAGLDPNGMLDGERDECYQNLKRAGYA